MTATFIETDDIGDWLYEHSDRASPCMSLRNRVSDEDYQVLLALSRMCTRSRRRSKLFDWDNNLEMWVLWDTWQAQNGRCAVTNVKLSTEQGDWHQKNALAASLDRIDCNNGYTSENVRIVTHFYNNMKNTWDDGLVNNILKEWYKCSPKQFQ
jgi:hypothetical protein